MRRRARSKMDDEANDSKWTHNTSAVAAAGNHPFKMDVLIPSPRQQRRSTVVNFTMTTAAGRGVPTLIIQAAASATRSRSLRD